MNGIGKENESPMKKVFGIGSVCILTCFMSCFMRNLLTCFNNDMKTAGYETTALRLLASTCAIACAAGHAKEAMRREKSTLFQCHGFIRRFLHKKHLLIRKNEIPFQQVFFMCVPHLCEQGNYI